MFMVWLATYQKGVVPMSGQSCVTCLSFRHAKHMSVALGEWAGPPVPLSANLHWLFYCIGVDPA